MSNSRGEIVEHVCSCGHKHRISERAITLSTSQVQALWRVFKWCKERGRHEFSTKEVKGLLDHTQYATFGDWVYFGGLVYKHQKASYGLNMERCEQFFANKLKVAMRVWKNPITKEARPEDPIWCREFPSIAEFLDADGFYMVHYRAPQATLL